MIGTLLLCAELFAIDAQFYLIFIGAGAIVVGLIGLAGIEFPVWGPMAVVRRIVDHRDADRTAPALPEAAGCSLPRTSTPTSAAVW